MKTLPLLEEITNYKFLSCYGSERRRASARPRDPPLPPVGAVPPSGRTLGQMNISVEIFARRPFFFRYLTDVGGQQYSFLKDWIPRKGDKNACGHKILLVTPRVRGPVSGGPAGCRHEACRPSL